MKRLFGGSQEAEAETFPVTHTDEEWRAKLSPAQYSVLRKHGTERAGTSPLNQEKRHGKFICAGCGQEVFASDTKFESRHRLAELLRPAGRGGGHHRGPRILHGAHRGALQQVRRPPRARVR